jgi:hypothetical protein
MALSRYVLFANPHLKPTEAIFWFMMQVGMVLGFLTAYPINIFLIKKGWKETMPRYKDELIMKTREQQSWQHRAA